MYCEDAPPVRHVKVNGQRSAPFSIFSGVQQGCPASPLIFLIAAEALSRVILDDKHLLGVEVGGTTLKLCQFADDTQFFLRNYAQLPRMWKHIDDFEEASGQRANQAKFEAIRLGASRRKTAPADADLRGIRLIAPHDRMILLGIPFGEQLDEEIFMEKLYLKVKSKMAAWHDHAQMTIFGRAMIANAMVYSRFRYVAQSMVIPDYLMQAIEEDVQTLLWARDASFDPHNIGTQSNFRRWMKNDAQYNERRNGLGVGVLHWAHHVQGLQANWLLKYNDATRGQWKEILDNWLARHHVGRGAVFTTVPRKELVASTTGRRPALPRFWKEAIAALRCMPLEQARPNHWPHEGARGHPLWDSPAFRLSSPYKHLWSTKLELRTAKDMVLDDGTPWPDETLLDFIDERLEQDTRGDWYIHKNRTGTFRRAAALKDWHRMVSKVPSALHAAACADQGELWRYSDAARSMMKNMGWQGGALRRGGLVEPIVPSASRVKRGDHTVDAAPVDPAKRAAQLREEYYSGWVYGGVDSGTPQPSAKPPAKKKSVDKMRAIIDDDVERYGTLCRHGLDECTFTMKGKPVHTGRVLPAQESEIRTVVRWKGEVKGIAESTFPHPKEWRLAGIDKPLDEIRVKDITIALNNQTNVEPSCLRAWEQRIGELPPDIGQRYNLRMLTPKDWASHFKNVLHRAMLTRAQQPGDKQCRCCDAARESLQHFTSCCFVGLGYVTFTVSWSSTTRANVALLL